jgi:hypothetical protein
MNQQDRLHLLAEQKFLREQLATLPESAKLTRMSDESRLHTIEEKLRQMPADEQAPARVQLTFNGRPVIGSYGIFADFGMKAVNSFTEAVSAMAASIQAPLASTGPIPNREQHQLLITNTALGSFGFELEEYLTQKLITDEDSPVAQALSKTRDLLQGTLGGTDEEFADFVSETDLRALEKIRGFLQILADNEAVCTLQYRERSVRFTDVGQIRKSLERLSQDNLSESEEILYGEFHGLLPKSRNFEFDLAEQEGKIITGKVSISIKDAESLNQHLYQHVEVKMMVTRIGGIRPRYVLLELPHWEDTK